MDCGSAEAEALGSSSQSRDIGMASVTDAVSSFSAFKLSPTTRRRSESLSLVPNWTAGPGRWDGRRGPGSGPRSVRCDRSVPMGPGGRGCSLGSSFLSPSWGAGGRLLGGSEGSEPGGPSPGTAFRGEGPPGRLGGPSAAPLSPPSGELRWLQGPDDT